MSGAPILFDRRLRRRHLARAAASFSQHSFLHAHAAEELAERLASIERTFARALLMGDRAGTLSMALEANPAAHKRIEYRISSDLIGETGARPRLVLDEEWLAIAPESLELIASLLSLHAVNDLPGALRQICQALAPDGLFLAALFGGDTLCEARAALGEAEIAVEGGLSPRVQPAVSLQDAAALLQRAGFALPVADRERLTVAYADPLALLAELRGMGETNTLTDRRRTPLRRATLAHFRSLYRQRHGRSDGRVEATFELLYLAGWAPHESQQKPLAPGSARRRLADALGTVEQSAGESAGTIPPKRP